MISLRVRFVHIYLVGYFALIGGAVFTLYRSNVWQKLPPVWTAGAVLAAIAAGLLLLAVSRKPKDTSKRRVEGESRPVS